MKDQPGDLKLTKLGQ